MADPPWISISIAWLENIQSSPERSQRRRDYLVTVARRGYLVTVARRDYLVTVARISKEKLWQTRRGAYQHYQGDQRLRKRTNED